MVTLNPIFASDMILQANKPVRFFGEGCGTVSVTLNGEKKECVSNGEWLIEFEPFDYGGPYDILVILDKTFFTLKNVYFGDAPPSRAGDSRPNFGRSRRKSAYRKINRRTTFSSIFSFHIGENKEV